MIVYHILRIIIWEYILYYAKVFMMSSILSQTHTDKTTVNTADVFPPPHCSTVLTGNCSLNLSLFNLL